MTCKELRWYFEDHLRDAEVRCARGAVTEHAATCPDCSRFVAEQRELGRSLREIRESVGPVPQSVDASVLLNYRRHVADQRTGHRVINGNFRPQLAWGLAALALALLLIVGSMLRARHVTSVSAVHATTAQADASVKEQPENLARDISRSAKPKLAAAKRIRLQRPERASVPLRTPHSVPEGFRSLMYCDELSCPQNMEMIRVQMPSSAMPRQASSFIQTSGSVTADVLVGPDGIARGIRFEEIEF